VLVVGGGVAGVATALAFGQLGIPVRLLEQADQIGAIGYGVQLGPNVQAPLSQLGISNEVLAASYLPSELQLYELTSGESLSTIALQTPAFFERYGGAHYMAIHRADLHEILLAACARYPCIDLNHATTVTSFTQDAHGVRLSTSDGQTIQGAALIAADGLRSRIRAQLHPQDAPRETGYFAHRAIVPMAQAPASLQVRHGVTMWAGEGFHVIYYPLRQRREMNIVVVVQAPGSIGTNDESGYRAHLHAIMKSARPEAREAIAVVNLERRWSIADRHPLRGWAQSKVTLIGDAAHAVLQSFAQGAGMAFEDVVCLRDLVRANGTNYALAFKQFERARLLRCTRLQLESRTLWDDYHCAGFDAQVRNARYQERNQDDLYRCLDWLWLGNAKH
jgi:3-hydroxybenzoate 6-monooxygenase